MRQQAGKTLGSQAYGTKKLSNEGVKKKTSGKRTLKPEAPGKAAGFRPKKKGR